MAASRHLWFDRTGNSAVRSAVPENYTRTKHEVNRITHCRDMAAGRYVGLSWIWRSTKWFFSIIFMICLFVFNIVHHNQLKKVQKSTNLALKIWFYAFLASMLDFWPPSWIWGKIWGGPGAFFSRSYCYTVWSAIGSSLLSVCPSVCLFVCLSVCLSVTLCILALRVGVRG